MDPKQLLTLVVRPTLKSLGAYSRSAEQLVMGTVYQESRAIYLKQLGGGPALGILQMEPATHNDLWENYLRYKPALANSVQSLASAGSCQDGVVKVNEGELVTNLAYAIAMCRVHYRRKREPLPPADDVQALGAYWKQHYNTVHGAGTVDEFVHNFPNEILTC